VIWPVQSCRHTARLLYLFSVGLLGLGIIYDYWTLTWQTRRLNARRQEDRRRLGSSRPA
jgi:hypothetical protein